MLKPQLKTRQYFKTHNILKLVLLYIFSILIGTLLLHWDIFLKPDHSVSWLEAFFMSNSSIATTGLTVVDYTTTYNYLGWIVMIVLFNIGGVGIILFNTMIILLFGGKLNFKASNMARLDYNQSSAIDLSYIVKNVIKYFLIIELVGTIILYIRMGDLFPNRLDRLMNALFLSASGISGSGFYDSTIINGDYIAMWTCSALMIFSFIGYPVILDLKGYIHAKKAGLKYRFSIFTKISLIVNVVTTLGFAFIFIMLEFNNAMAGYGWFEKINAGMYVSLSTKSVGLNLFKDINTWMPLTLFIQSIFMLIGGAPSSACGGIKTNAIYIFWRYLKSLFKGQDDVIIYNRKVPDKTVKLSLVLILLFISISGIVTMIISCINPEINIANIWFDVVSGFTTTGFSTGALAQFDQFSVFLMAILMGVGRIGVLNILMMLNKNNEKNHIQYVERGIAI